MTDYIFDDIYMPAGTLSLKFTINDGYYSTHYVNGPHILKVGKTTESIEETGVGGIPRISDLEMEIHDKENIFRNTIFATAITTIYADLRWTNTSGTFSYFHGKVDKSTIKYNTYYDDAGGIEYHTASFMVLSMIQDLSVYPGSSLRTALYNNDMFILNDHTYMHYIMAKDVFKEIAGLINANYTHELTGDDYRYYNDPGDVYHFDDLVYAFWDSDHYPNWQPHWQNSNLIVGSYMQLGDVKSILQAICSDLLAFPVFTYDLGANKVKMTIRPRWASTTVDEAILGRRRSSARTSFYGYDALRTQTTIGVYMPPPEIQPGGPFSGVNRAIYPSTMSDDVFNLVPHKFDHNHFIYISGNDALQVDYWNYFIYHTSHLDPLPPLRGMISHNGTYTNYGTYLLDNFLTFWASPEMLEREYVGLGFGADQVNLLDRITVDGTNYSSIEIVRDVVANTKKIKMVKY